MAVPEQVAAGSNRTEAGGCSGSREGQSPKLSISCVLLQLCKNRHAAKGARRKREKERLSDVVQEHLPFLVSCVSSRKGRIVHF